MSSTLRHILKSSLRPLSSRLTPHLTPRPLLLLPTPGKPKPFHTSPPTNATSSPEGIEDFQAAFLQSPLYAKIKDNAGAIEAIKGMADVLLQKGINPGEKPSMTTMMKLAMDSDLRAAMQKVMQELTAAGIEVTPESLKSLIQLPPSPPK